MAFTAAQHRAYRATRKASGKPRSRGAKTRTLFDVGQFVAIDGEGFSEGAAETFSTGKLTYVAQPHNYALLAASDGSEIYAPDGRLSAEQCLNFLIEAQANTPHAILVTFGASYDMCQMLMHDLPREALHSLMHGDNGRFSRRYADVTLGAWDYRIEVKMRKQLTIARWPKGAEKYERHHKRDGSRIWRLTAHDKATLWDVWGFFQGTFIAALDRWLPDDADYQFIVRMKGDRSVFDRSEINTIRQYNAAELRCLVAMMDKVRDAVRGMGLSISRWDGAGAIAAAMFRAHEVKRHMAETPGPVFDAARVAYSGGHIEMCKLGYHRGTVHHYDISSAYPHQFRLLPSLAGGTWHHGTGTPPEGFTLVSVQFRFTPGMPFYPLFYRQENGAILYPERGAGWYWFPEFDVARAFAARYGAIEFRIVEWWSFHPAANVRPFAWIETYFDRRKWLIDDAKARGVPRPGEEYTLRLGYNACYGKTAQQVGARWQDGELVPPGCFQLEWSGYVTAGCRAQVMAAAMQAPDAIIAMATDGLFSLRPLDLDCPAEKILGTWEYTRHDGMTAVMPGVYWLHDGERTTHHSRGFKLSDVSDASLIHKAWSRGADTFDVAVTRFITLGTALTSETMWAMRGRFVSTTKQLCLDGDNSKRLPIALRRERPHRRMVDTRPRDLWEDYDMDLAALASAPYPIEWLDHADDGDAPDAIPGESETACDDDVLAAFLA